MHKRRGRVTHACGFFGDSRTVPTIAPRISPRLVKALVRLDGTDVPIAETIRGFREIIEGKHDALPEQAFYMQGTIDEVVENAKKMASAA